MQSDYTQEKLQADLQAKINKNLVQFILANPRETESRKETPELNSFTAVVSVEPIQQGRQPRKIYVDIECNNFVKFKALPGETKPDNFMPEVMEFPAVLESGEVIAHSFIHPMYNEVQPSIIRFCNFPHFVQNNGALVFSPDLSLTETFFDAFIKIAEVKCNLGSFKNSCLVCEGDFDPMFICGELLRGNRARNILATLQKMFPEHPDLQKDWSVPDNVWSTVADLLRFINFKDEFARFFPSNPDRTRNDLDYILTTLGLKFQQDEHHHAGKDDTKKVLEAHNALRTKCQNSEPLFVKSIKIVPSH